MSFDAELRLLQAVERVQELHKPDAEYPQMCEHCTELLKQAGWVQYPCPTIQALDGEQE